MFRFPRAVASKAITRWTVFEPIFSRQLRLQNPRRSSKHPVNACWALRRASLRRCANNPDGKRRHGGSALPTMDRYCYEKRDSEF
jgi:hypothetical protein